MNKRIVLTIAGVAVVVAVVWLTTRPGESGATAEQAPSASTVSVTPPPTDDIATPLGSTERMAANLPRVSTDALAMQPGVSPPTQAGQALPIDVSPGFEYLSKPAAEMKDTDGMWPTWRLHQQLQSEPRDEVWAPRMEAALRSGIQDSLTARGFDTQRIELPVIECRTNGCEIQAVGYPGDMRKGIDLQRILPSLMKDSLAGEFELDGSRLTHTSRPDQRITILAQLSREKT